MRLARLPAGPQAASMRRPVRWPRYWCRRCSRAFRLRSTSRRRRRSLRRRIPRSRLPPANKETACSIQPPIDDAFFWSRFESVCVALVRKSFCGLLPPSVVVNGPCDTSATGDAKVGRRAMPGTRCGGYRRGRAFARDGARGNDGARRQKNRCVSAKESDAPAPVARAPSGIGASHVLNARTTSPAVRASVGRVVFALAFFALSRKSNGRVSAFFRVRSLNYFLIRSPFKQHLPRVGVRMRRL